MAKRKYVKSGKHTSGKPRKVRLYEGLPLVDATKDIEIVINKQDVAASRKKDPGNCAAALAGRRELHTDVRVYMSRMYVKDKKNKRWIRFITPNAASREITAFDRGAGFEPGEYTFKAPSPTRRLDYYKPTGPKTENTGNGKRPKHTTANVRVSARQDFGDK